VKDNRSDLEVIHQVLNGEVSIYGVLVDKYKDFAFTIAYRIMNNKADAEEVAQDAFIKAFRGLPKFNKEAKFATWLYRIVFNTAISYKRKQKREIVDAVEEIPMGGVTADNMSLESADQKKYIALAMTQLLPLDATIITLYYLKELSLDEIVQITELNMNTLKVRLFRARKRMAKELESILKSEAVAL
jgi:RNA polymerase sigma-70 factor (ECF subfamily)